MSPLPSDSGRTKLYDAAGPYLDFIQRNIDLLISPAGALSCSSRRASQSTCPPLVVKICKYFGHVHFSIKDPAVFYLTPIFELTSLIGFTLGLTYCRDGFLIAYFYLS